MAKGKGQRVGCDDGGSGMGVVWKVEKKLNKTGQGLCVSLNKRFCKRTAVRALSRVEFFYSWACMEENFEVWR